MTDFTSSIDEISSNINAAVLADADSIEQADAPQESDWLSRAGHLGSQIAKLPK